MFTRKSRVVDALSCATHKYCVGPIAILVFVPLCALMELDKESQRELIVGTPPQYTKCTRLATSTKETARIQKKTHRPLQAFAPRPPLDRFGQNYPNRFSEEIAGCLIDATDNLEEHARDAKVCGLRPK